MKAIRLREADASHHALRAGSMPPSASPSAHTGVFVPHKSAFQPHFLKIKAQYRMHKISTAGKP